MVTRWHRPYRGVVGSRTRLLGLGLGALLIVLGVAETIRAVSSGDGGVVFWFGPLVGGGVLTIAGTVLADRFPGPSLAMTVVGWLLGSVPTMWTLVVPILLLVHVVLRFLGPTGTPVGTSRTGPA